MQFCVVYKDLKGKRRKEGSHLNNLFQIREKLTIKYVPCICFSKTNRSMKCN